MVGGSMPRILQTAALGPLISKRGKVQMGVLVAKPNKEDLSYLADLVASGELTPAIDRHYELREVPAALTYLGEGHALGKIVIKIEERFLR